MTNCPFFHEYRSNKAKGEGEFLRVASETWCFREKTSNPKIIDLLKWKTCKTSSGASVEGDFMLLGVNENNDLWLNINTRALVEQPQWCLHFLGILAGSGATVALLSLFHGELIHLYMLLGAPLSREAPQKVPPHCVNEPPGLWRARNPTSWFLT